MKLAIKIAIAALLIVFLVAIDLGLFRDHAPYNYSVLRHLYCAVVKQDTYDHISVNSRYASSGDYMYIYQCGTEWDDKYPPG